MMLPTPVPKARVPGSGCSICCRVWAGVPVPGPHLPASLSRLGLSHSSQDYVPFYLCHYLLGLLLSFFLCFYPGPSSFVSLFTHSSLTEYGSHSGVLAGHWSACVCTSLGHHLLVFLLPPCPCGPFPLHCVCSVYASSLQLSLCALLSPWSTHRYLLFKKK